MAARLLLSNKLLQYDPDYRVLICRECEYAIQKSAVDSHLLKHKIYRGDRHNLLDEISQLELLEPEDVPLPSSILSPIGLLPVLAGHRCESAGCTHLTVSEKRMRLHWNEAHGGRDSVLPLQNFARPANLQTFFRGNKVRYFEVRVPASDAVGEKIHRGPGWSASPTAGGGESHDDRMAEVALQKASKESITPRTSFELDLETLKMFHHFMSSTASTLPGSTKYWETKVASTALGDNDIMCGMLAISACHLAVLAADSSEASFYAEQQSALASKFLSTWSLGPETEWAGLYNVSPSSKDVQLKSCASRLAVVLRCAQWAVACDPRCRTTVDSPSLEMISRAIRNCTVSVSDHPQGCTQDIDSHSSSKTTLDIDHEHIDNAKKAARKGLQTLPSRMVEVCEKPKSNEDFFAVLSTLSTLIECSDVPFVSNDARQAWQIISAWSSKVPDRFHAMVAQHDPAALVVLAHFASTLVRRAKHAGCWVLGGITKRILLKVNAQLSMANPAALSLVEGMSDDME